VTFEHLLAKSQGKGEPWRPSMLLHEHLSDVHRAAVQVLDMTGDEQLAALDLDPAVYRDRFRRIVRTAAACHDLGKANNHFLEMLLGKRRLQGLRHEWATLEITDRDLVRTWLLSAVANDPRDWQIVLWAIAGHHPAYNRPSPPRLAVDGAGAELTLLLGHRDFGTCLQIVGQALGLIGPPPALTDVLLRLVGPENVFLRIAHRFQQAASAWGDYSEAERRLVAAAKNCLVAADVAGSALPRNVIDPVKRSTWIGEAFTNKPKPDQLAGLVAKRLGGKEPYPFQADVARSASPVTFVRAGCGSGKTVAAYLWAARQHPGKRLYFCYPTTGTATEGYRDYLHNADAELDTRLFHGRAEVDLEMILKTGPDEEGPEADAAARIESLDAWSTPVVNCTVDTVLGIVQNNRRGLYAWPALAGAAFVFDEIHAYDDRLFGAMLRFLRDVPGAPALLMTASLPAARLKALQDVMMRRKQILAKLPKKPLASEGWKRYRRQGAVDERDPWPEIHTELDRGGKVLWVSNTVDRVMAAADKAAAEGFPQRLIYHSRFRYANRVDRHSEVVKAFTEEVRGPVLACTSQVCEMSLDLKGVTLLVTELAPASALIQRLGRLNRQATAKTPARPFLVIVPDRALPYAAAELETATEWLRRLGDAALSQGELSAKWEEIDAGRRPDFVESAWLDGGPATTVLELRDASPGITVLLQSDEDAVRSGALAAAKAALPMPPPPRGVDWKQWSAVKGMPIVPPEFIAYDRQRGAQWRKLERA
jgi:CRISPR-associated endonuclease/helicase Cas3